MSKSDRVSSRRDRGHKPTAILNDPVPSLPSPTAASRGREMVERTLLWEQISPKKHRVALKDWPRRLIDVLSMHEGDDAERRAALSAGSQIVPRAELNIEIRQLKIYTEELRGWSFALDHEIGDSVIGSSITEPRLENLRQLDSAILADAPGTRPKSFHDLRMEHTILEEVTRLLMQFADMEHHAASEERRQAKRLSETFRVDLAPHLSIEQEQRWVMRIGTPQPSAEEQS